LFTYFEVVSLLIDVRRKKEGITMGKATGKVKNAWPETK
jgi:hypothetical protein